VTKSIVSILGFVHFVHLLALRREHDVSEAGYFPPEVKEKGAFRIEVIETLKMLILFFWVMTPCGLVGGC
jgi:hypothetical protein